MLVQNDAQFLRVRSHICLCYFFVETSRSLLQKRPRFHHKLFFDANILKPRNHKVSQDMFNCSFPALFQRRRDRLRFENTWFILLSRFTTLRHKYSGEVKLDITLKKITNKSERSNCAECKGQNAFHGYSPDNE